MQTQKKLKLTIQENNIKQSNHPTPINEEIILDPTKNIMSKTDSKGVIEYANDYFMTISGYDEFELMGKPHNIIRHPDMPKLVFKVMWEELKKGNSIFALVKNLAKDRRYYWVLVSFEIKKMKKAMLLPIMLIERLLLDKRY